MEIVIKVGKFLILLFAIANVAIPLYSNRRNYNFVWSVLRRFRIKMFLECFGLILVTVICAFALISVPGLKYGWLHLFGGSGNILVAPVVELSSSTTPWIRLFVPLFLLAFAFMLPFFANWEEKEFRKGYLDHSSIIKQSIMFGLIHCTVGIPISIGIALIIPGLFFAVKYKNAFYRNLKKMSASDAEEEAVMVSTTYHTMWNMILVTVAFVASLMMV